MSTDNFSSMAFLASPRPDAAEAKARLEKRYGSIPLDTAETIIALGGDGIMLDALHRSINTGARVFGLNFGSVGFLMNESGDNDLPERISKAEQALIHPLRTNGEDINGNAFEALAINEVSLLRETRQTAKIKIRIDDRDRLSELQADGVLVATAAGSTAYNLSAHGPILPLDSKVLALTPISAFRPRRWRGALLPHTAKLSFEILDPLLRPVSAVADNREFREVAHLEVVEAADLTLKLLFDEGKNLSERILAEQFEN
ncbi:MAG: NAD kinase [Maricaulis sp.]|nr:NAD kinase [Maricaulis sp.]MDG2043938.1 NAD kinase [Maricaulis sp.]